jgi:hypothetical protein
MKIGPYSLSEIRKTVVAFVGFVVVVLAALDPMHVLPADWQPWVTLILAVAGNYGVFKVRNVRAPGEPVKPHISEAERA